MDFRAKRTRAGLVVGGATRRRTLAVGLILAPLSGSPYALAILREAYFGQDALRFVVWYSLALLLVFACFLVLSLRAGGRLFQLYADKRTSVGRVGRVANVVFFSLPVAGDLIVLGVPGIIAKTPPLAALGAGLTAILTNLVTGAISGVVGNFAYDVVKRMSKPSNRPGSAQP